jgi:plastocyanin
MVLKLIQNAVVGVIITLLPLSLLAGPYQTIKVSNGGTISGTIKFAGKRPANPTLKVTKDVKFCGAAIKADYYVIGAGGGLKNAVVVIENIDKGKAYNKAAIIPFDNKKCMFKPHVSTAVAGQRLGIVSRDPILHNTHLYHGPKKRTMYNIAIPLQNIVIKKPLRRSGKVTVKCDAHEWMLGYVYVAKSPYITKTVASGRFVIKDVPPGNYKIKIWHEKLGEVTKEVVVRAGGVTALNHTFGK